MRRDWPLVASGFGILVLSASLAVPPMLAYQSEIDPPCPAPEPPARLIDGCTFRPGGFEWWISQPGVIIFFAVSFLLLIVALVVMHRGFTSRSPGAASGG